MLGPGLPESDADVVAEFRRLAVRVAEQRERAVQLRALADHAESQADRDERILGDICAVAGFSDQLSLEDLDPRLRGPRLEEIAVQLLRQARTDEPIHYREWFGLLRAAGHYVGGKDPLATFLTQINRSASVERVGPRSGLYRLRVAV